MRHWVVFAAIIFVLIATTGAFAQLDAMPKNTHMFAPTVDHSGIITTYGTEYLGTFRFAYSFWVDDAIAPLDYHDPETRPPGQSIYEADRVSLIQHQLGATVNFAFGITDYIVIGYAFPYIITRSFDENYDNDGTLGTTTNSFEDMRLDIKVLALQRTRHCLGLGLVNTLTIPMYEKHNYASDEGVTVAPRLIFDIGRGSFWTIAFNAGYKYYSTTPAADQPLLLEDLEIGDELVGGLGAKFRFSNRQELLVDTAVKTLVDAPFGNPDADYVEVSAAYRKYWVRMNYNALTLGASSAAFTDGVGGPFIRIFLGFGRDENRAHYAFKEATGQY